MKKFPLILLTATFLLPLISYAEDAPPAAPPAPDVTLPTPPPSGAAYQFQRQGIFDCNQSGSYAMSVGALSAIGGAYVPVSDAAVELNTGTLVYKECVLREVVDRESEDADSALVKQINNDIQTGRNGNPQFVVNEGLEKVTGASDPTYLAFLQDSALWNQVNPDLVTKLKGAGAQYYEGERGGEQATSVACPYKGSLNSYWAGQVPFNFTDFFNASQPQCDPVTENFFLQDISDARIARALQYQQDQWNWANGFYSRTDQNGNIITPGIITEQLYSQALQSPFNKLQNANDIGQMVGALFAGLSTQIVGSQSGLSGLTQSIGGQPSYLDQVAKESSQGLQGAAQNAALQILNAAQRIESAFYQAVTGTLQSLTQTQSQLRAAEAQCWKAVISKVCATPLRADNTCTSNAGPCTVDDQGNPICPTGGTIKVATSTAFSSAVISSQITPLLSAANTGVQQSRTALQLISNLVQGITNTTSLDAQRVALSQLDSLVAQHQLHSQTDLQNATQQQQTVSDTMSSLLQTIAQIWGGSGADGTGNIPWDGTINPGNGWCNVNNPATISAWIQTWSKQ